MYRPSRTRSALRTVVTAAMVPIVAGVGPDLSVWAPAEDAGRVTVVDGRVAFRHPLARAGSYHGAPAYLRDLAHRDLAALLTADAAECSPAKLGVGSRNQLRDLLGDL
jgi:hypothetical protein